MFRLWSAVWGSPYDVRLSTSPGALTPSGCGRSDGVLSRRMPTMTELTKADRGYDAKFQQERRRWAKRVDRGLMVQCACDQHRPRCRLHLGRCPVIITKGIAFDLGHHDQDRSLALAPECRGCNRSAGADASNKPPIVKIIPMSRPATAQRW
jgi:hypothetical protein